MNRISPNNPKPDVALEPVLDIGLLQVLLVILAGLSLEATYSHLFSVNDQKRYDIPGNLLNRLIAACWKEGLRIKFATKMEVCYNSRISFTAMS